MDSDSTTKMTMKFEIEKYNRDVNFGLWQIKIHAVLVQQGVSKVLKGNDKMPKEMTEDEKEEIDEKALMSIQLCLSDKVLQEVVHEKTAASH